MDKRAYCRLFCHPEFEESTESTGSEGSPSLKSRDASLPQHDMRRYAYNREFAIIYFFSYLSS